MADYRAVLADYDRREDAIKTILQKQKGHTSEGNYKSFEQAFAKERAAMAKRRAILESWIQEDIEN